MYASLLIAGRYGGPCRSPRNDTPRTPPGPEGCNGSGRLVCRGVAGRGHLQYPLSVPCFLSLQYSQIVTDFPCVYGYHAHILSLAGRLEFNELSGTCAEVATTFL